MSYLRIDTSNLSKEQINQALSEGQMEVVWRKVSSRFSSFTNCAVNLVDNDKRNNVLNVACAAMQLLNTGAESWIQHRSNRLSQLELRNVRGELKQMARERDYCNERIDEILFEMPMIFQELDSLKDTSSVIYQLSVANLNATLNGNEVINTKLDHITDQINILNEKIDKSFKHDYVKDIKEPSKKVVLKYHEIVFALKQGKPVSEKDFLDAIRQCCVLMESIYDLRDNIGLDNAVGLIYGLLPAFTDMIIQYYICYFDPENPIHDAHNSWLNIFGLLDSSEFKEDLQFHLFTVDKLSNRDVNSTTDYLLVKRKKYERKINRVITELRKCGSSIGYAIADDQAELIGQQFILECKKKLSEKIGEDEAENIVAAIKYEMENKDYLDEPTKYQKLDYPKLFEQQMNLRQKENTADVSNTEKSEGVITQSIQIDKNFE